jgi:hypothetical protein
MRRLLDPPTPNHADAGGPAAWAKVKIDVQAAPLCRNDAVTGGL